MDDVHDEPRGRERTKEAKGETEKKTVKVGKLNHDWPGFCCPHSSEVLGNKTGDPSGVSKQGVSGCAHIGRAIIQNLDFQFNFGFPESTRLKHRLFLSVVVTIYLQTTPGEVSGFNLPSHIKESLSAQHTKVENLRGGIVNKQKGDSQIIKKGRAISDPASLFDN